MVSACLVTRGDVDMGPVLDSLPFADVVVWDNSAREDLACYGRFAAVTEAKHDWIYTQDDDLVVPVEKLLFAWERRREVFANRKPDEPWRFLGAGSLFPRSFVTCLDWYVEKFGRDHDFCRVADVVFAYQHPYRSVWVGYQDLPWQTADNRMYHQPDHYVVRERARDRVIDNGKMA